MIYEVASTPEEFRACEELIGASKYYDPVDLTDLGGLVLVAKTDDGDLAGCVWFGTIWRRAYIDYLAVDPKYSGTAPRLLARLRVLFEQGGVKQVHFNIHEDNKASLRLATVFGADLSGPFYSGVAKIGVPDGGQD